MRPVLPILVALLCGFAFSAFAEEAYQRTDLFPTSSFDQSRSTSWQPGEGIPLEVGGMAFVGPDRLAVAIRKGDVWFIDGVHGAATNLTFSRFASGLHEPLGLLVDGDDLLVSQRSEITRLQDRDRDGSADAYLTVGKGWQVSGSYHAYVYGPERGPDGKLWATLNLDMGDHADNTKGWRGWGGTLSDEGAFVPQSSGMRSPCGLGANASGDLFFSDQQGTWIPATPIHHLRPGVFYGNQEALPTHAHPDAPFAMNKPPKPWVLYPEAVKSHPRLVPPAIWLPYNKMGRSATDLERIPKSFGRFAGQMLVGEFTNSSINRLFLEKVNGQYQGACFRFLDGFPSAVMRLRFSPRGSLFVGMTNRGWSSLGARSYGLYRVDLVADAGWFDWEKIEAHPEGFLLSFTETVNLPRINPFSVTSFTYEYSPRYGGPEKDQKVHATQLVRGLNPDQILLKVEGLREGYIYEISTEKLTAQRGEPLVHSQAWYTLNAIPKKKAAALPVKPAKAARPHVVMILADDLGVNNLGCYGGKDIRTPNLDQLARDGMHFSQFYTTAPICTPARASLMTGCYPSRVGLGTPLHTDARSGLHADEITVPELLKTQGYDTACFGKWHLGHLPEFYPTRHGFDTYRGTPLGHCFASGAGRKDGQVSDLFLAGEREVAYPAFEELTAGTVRAATDWLEKRSDSDTPFFLYLPLAMPHTPLAASKKFRGKSNAGLYGDVVEELDAHLGKLFDTLARLNLADNTLVLFSSDNGAQDEAHNRPFRGRKQQVLEGGMRVPMIARWPAVIPKKSRCDRLLSLMDVLPTFARLAGAELPQDRVIDGRDFSGLLRDPQAPGPHEEFVYHARFGKRAGIRVGDWKLLVPCDAKTWRHKGDALYNLAEDPGERNNVAPDHPERVRRLRARLAAFELSLSDNLRPAGSF